MLKGCNEGVLAELTASVSKHADGYIIPSSGKLTASRSQIWPPAV